MRAFAEPGQRFIALDGPLGCVARPNPSPRGHTAFHQSMIVFHHIMQLLAWSEKAGLREGSVWLVDVEGRGGRGVLLDGDHPGCERM
jgi:hypothetical protein